MADYLMPLSRNELLKTGGNRTMQEMVDMGLGRIDMSGGRRFLLVSETAQARPIPLKLLEAAKRGYDLDHDPVNLFNYLYAGFTIYREPAYHDHWLSPLVMVDGVCEFPEPATTSWSNRDDIVTLGMMLGSFEEAEATIATAQGNKLISTNILTGQTAEKEKTRLQLYPHTTLEFKIPSFNDVRLVNYEDFQRWLLRAYALPMSRALEDLRRNNANPDLIEKFANELFAKAGLGYSLPVLRYAKENEISNTANLAGFKI